MSSGTSIDARVHFKPDSHPPRNKHMKLNEVGSVTSGAKNHYNNNKPFGNNHQRRNSQRQQDHTGGAHAGHKRRYTFSGGNAQDYKCAFKKRRRNGLIVPPTKFLLGGNINDPLNLESLKDEEINKKMNEVTPYSSPVPPPLRHHEQIEVLIPQNIRDPLNLNSGKDIEFKLISPKSKKRRKNKQKKKNLNAAELATVNTAPVATEPGTEKSGTEKSGTEAIVSIDQPTPSVKEDAVAVETSLNEDSEMKEPEPVEKEPIKAPPVVQHQHQHHHHHHQHPQQIKINQDRVAMDKIVSPVVPQGSPLKFHRRYRSWSFSKDNDDKTSKNSKKHQKQQKKQDPKFRKKDEQFQYGNYNRYYGYRYGSHNTTDEDPRLKKLKNEWFQDKSVLDIGCNVGFLTLAIARDRKPRKIIGMDIDEKLVKVARKNVSHYLKPKGGGGKTDFPISMAICHGPLATTVIPKKEEDEVQFPNNVFFVHGNYVPESEELLEIQKPEFNTILCLSLTKWLHLNFGDDGLKRAFRRMFAQLRPGGKLILEAQPWPSYGKKKKLTEIIYKNYHQIKFRPDQFNEYLLSSEVGFSTCELIDTPAHPSKGFCRAMYVLTKSDVVSCQAAESECDKKS